MKKIRYYDNGTKKYSFIDIDSGSLTEDSSVGTLPDIEGLPSQRFARSADGRYDYLWAFRYTLRDDMERKIRRRFFRKDNESGEMREMFTKWDRSGFQPNACFFLKDNLLFMIASYSYGDNAAYIVDIESDFDGENVKEVWRTKGYPYGFHMNPKGTMLAFHIAGGDRDEFNPYGYYSINLMEPDGTRHLVCAEDGHLLFGPTWSPDGSLLVFQDCVPANDPGHHYTDIAVCNPDGTGFRRLTEGRPCYFATAFGLEGHRMGGSNCPIWTPDSKLICTPMLPGSHPDCRYDPTQRNHEELIYDPTMGKGGCGFILLDPITSEKRVITPAVEGCWDFRPCLSADGKQLLYTHSEFGKAGEIRLLNLESGEIRTITNGTDGLGADHAKFV